MRAPSQVSAGRREPNPRRPSPVAPGVSGCPAGPRTSLSRPALQSCRPPARRAPGPLRCVTWTGPRSIRPQGVSVHAPGSGVTERISRSMAIAGFDHSTRASAAVTLPAYDTPSRGLWPGRKGAVGDAVQGREQQRRAGDGQPAEQVARGVGRLDLLGDDAVDRTGVHAFLQPEGGGAGDVVACPDRGLDGTGSAPGGQQREVQVDPAMGRHIQDRPRQQRPVGDDGGGVRSQRSEFVRELAAPWPKRVSAPGGLPRRPARRPVTGSACGRGRGGPAAG